MICVGYQFFNMRTDAVQIPDLDAVIHTSDFPCVRARPDVRDFEHRIDREVRHVSC